MPHDNEHSPDQHGVEALEARVRELQQELDIVTPLAYTDELTGLKNRHALARSFNELAESDMPFGLIFADIKNFKRVNDRLSHAAGDDALRLTAAHLASSVYHNLGQSFREHDVVATDFTNEAVIASRHGGDEFVVLMPYAPRGPEGAELTLDQTLAQVADRYARDFIEIPEIANYNAKAPKEERIGLRIGYAVREADQTLGDVLAAADPKGRAPEHYLPPKIRNLPLGEQTDAGMRAGVRIAQAGGSALRAALSRKN